MIVTNGFLAGIRKLRDTSCIDLIINEDSLRTQKDANQAILDIFNTFGSHICELEDAVTEPFVIIDPNAPDTTDLEDGWMWADSSTGYSGYDLYVLDNGVWVPVSSASEGEKGDDGKSAYEIWLEQGNTGTEQDFLDSLRGEAATVDVGTTTTVEPDQPAKVTNSGDEFNAILDFEIPKGEKGDVGPSKVDLEYTKFVDMGLMTPKRGTETLGVPAIIPEVTETHAGLMTPFDKHKLDGLSDAINFRGQIDLTNVDEATGGIAYPNPLDNGDLYVNIGAGVPVIEYNGIYNNPKYPTVDGGELCIYDEDDDEWDIVGTTDIDASVDLDYVPSPYRGEVTNTAGDDATIPVVDLVNAGLMTPEDKIKLDSIPTDAYDGSAIIADDDLNERVELIEDNLELEIALEMENDNDLFYYRTLITKNKHSEFAYYDWMWEIDYSGNGSFPSEFVSSEGLDITQTIKDKLGFVDASSYLLRCTNKDEYPDARVRYYGKVTFGEKFDGDPLDGVVVDNTKTSVALNNGSDWISMWGTP